MKLRTKLAIAVFTVMLVLSGVVLGSVQLFKQQTIAAEKGNLEETANLTAKQIDAAVQRRENEMRLFAQKQIENFSNTEAYLPELVGRSDAIHAALAVDANGTVIGREGFKKAPRYVGNESYVQQALNGRVVTSEPERVNATGQTVSERFAVKIAVPVGMPKTLDENATAEGVLVGGVYLNVGEYFSSTRALKTSTQSITVYDTLDGERVALLPPDKTFEQNLSATATVESTGWTVRVTRDRSILAGRLQNLAFIQGLGLLLAIGSVVALGVWDYRTNLKQTERLLEGFTELQQGNFAYDLSLAAADEWAKISDGFNEMAQGLKEREQAIREREQRLGVLNRVLRHNLQNDMGVIINYAEMIPSFDDDEQEQMAVDKIVSMGKGLIEHGKKARNIEDAMESAEQGTRPVDVSAMVEDAIEEFSGEYPDATVKASVPDGVDAEAITALDYAIDNVVENAFEHNDAPEPRVEVSVTEDDDTVTVTVRDNGPGIPEYEQNVFGDREETDLEHGSGIGLWLAYWVVEKSGGRLYFGDAHDGGAVVCLALEATPGGGEAGVETVDDAESEATAGV